MLISGSDSTAAWRTRTCSSSGVVSRLSARYGARTATGKIDSGNDLSHIFSSAATTCGSLTFE